MADYNTETAPVGEEDMNVVLKTIDDAKNYLQFLKQNIAQLKVAESATRMAMKQAEADAVGACHSVLGGIEADIEEKKLTIKEYTQLVGDLTHKLHNTRNELLQLKEERLSEEREIAHLSIWKRDLNTEIENLNKEKGILQNMVTNEQTFLATVVEDLDKTEALVEAYKKEQTMLEDKLEALINDIELKGKALDEREAIVSSKEQALGKVEQSVDLKISTFESEYARRSAELESFEKASNEKALLIEADQSAIKIKAEELELKSLMLQKKEAVIAKREKLLKDAGITLGESK